MSAPAPTLLAIDATARRCAVLVRAAQDSGAGDVALEELLDRGHDARLAPMAAEAMTRAGVRPTALERVVVATGPGSFTGVRLGVAFARGLALALGIPAVGVSCLDALAATVARKDARALLIVAHDAKRGETVWRAYRGGAPASEPALSAIAEAAAAIDALRGGETAALAGTGAGALAGPGRIDLDVTTFDMAALADLGAAADPETAPARAFYHRPPDAKLPGGRDPVTETTGR